MLNVSLKAFNSLTAFWNIVKEVNPESIEQEARQQFRILVVGPNADSNNSVASALTIGLENPGKAVETAQDSGNGSIDSLPSGDLYVYVVPHHHVADVAHAHRISEIEMKGKPVVLAICSAGNGGNGDVLPPASSVFTTLPAHRVVSVRTEGAENVAGELFSAIFASLPRLHLSLARTLPAFRDQFATSLIMETSRVNAEFALFSSLPGSIPIVGEMFATGADMFVLTKNQVMLVFKLATIFGRDYESKTRVLAEIAPVVGGAFLWRTAARTAVGLVPGVFSALPKALVAFTGTFVVGSAARYYYSVGAKPTGKTLDQFYGDALSEARSLFSKRRAIT